VTDRQLALLTAGDGDAETRPDRVGHASVSYRRAGSILTRASGFIGDYDFTLNPYSGCTFACTYCYAAFFVRDRALQDSWGDWVQVKDNALDTLRRMRTPLAGKRIYMSSVTDPYQPVERQLRLVRDLLEALIPQQPRLVVQTRSPLVTRDIDLYRRFSHVRINMTVTTDSERVRRAFEPHCPSTRARLSAIRQVTDAGLPTCVTMTPLLPVEDPAAFARALRDTGVRRFVVQPFHVEKGRFVAGTRDQAKQIVDEMGWDHEAYERAVDALRRHLPHLDEGRAGFAPE